MSRLLLSLGVGLALGCTALPALREPAPRVSDYAQHGDARFRASQRLVIEGLDADAAGDAARARGRYERALQIDSSNPWIYLALARHHVERGESGRALAHVERARALFESSGDLSPGAVVECVHCDGLRGAALALQGRSEESRALLDAAARAAPDVWGDARLSALELR